MYRTPIAYIEPIGELEAADTPPINEPACREAGYSDCALTIPWLYLGKCSLLMQEIKVKDQQDQWEK